MCESGKLALRFLTYCCMLLSLTLCAANMSLSLFSFIQQGISDSKKISCIIFNISTLFICVNIAFLACHLRNGTKYKWTVSMYSFNYIVGILLIFSVIFADFNALKYGLIITINSVLLFILLFLINFWINFILGDVAEKIKNKSVTTFSAFATVKHVDEVQCITVSLYPNGANINASSSK